MSKLEEVGLTKGNAFVLSNGDSILLHNEEARLGPRIHVDNTMLMAMTLLVYQLLY